MEEPDEQQSFSSKTKTPTHQCKICSAPALHSNYGAMTCYSCKIFFKRHVTIIRKPLTCNFDGHCEININTRHTCSACRLEKCFAQGMQAELIRGPLSKKIPKNNNTTMESISATSNILTTEPDRSHWLPTTNLLQTNDSILTADQWSLINNLIYSYDERKLLVIAQQFLDSTDANHHRIVFNEFFMKIYEITGIYIRSNSDFCSLFPDDRSAFVRNIAENIHCLGTAFTWKQSQIHNNQTFIDIFLDTYGHELYTLMQTILKYIDSDFITAKLALSIFAFCNHTSMFSPYKTNGPLNSQSIARIQNIYSEVTWKYLLHQFGYRQAVERFNRLIQCLLTATTTISNIQNLPKHVEDMKTLVEQTELLFVFDDIEHIDETKN